MLNKRPFLLAAAYVDLHSFMSFPILELRYDGVGLVWTVEIEWMIHSKNEQ